MLRIAVAFGLSVLGLAALAVASPTTADAYCNGNAAWTMNSNYGHEKIRGTTCDEENDYFGKSIDDNVDGYCLWLDYHWAGINGHKNCPNSVWLNYSFQDNNNSSRFRPCRWDPSPGLFETNVQACQNWRDNKGY
jgi:hypothetical protein